MPNNTLKLLLTLLFCSPSMAHAGLITTFTDRSAFNNTVGNTTLEDFTDLFISPIPNGSLSSTSSFGGLSLGDIQEGATYSTPIGTGIYFNIDNGDAFVGGYLNGKFASDRILTITYNPLVSAFGFDVSKLLGDLILTINFVSGARYDAFFTFPQSAPPSLFFGFQSNLNDIQSVLLSTNVGSSFSFAIDNHVFGGPSSTDNIVVPTPTGLVLILTTFLFILLPPIRLKQSKIILFPNMTKTSM